MSKQPEQAVSTGAAFATRAVHAGHAPDPQTGAHVQPIYATSTFSYGTAERGARLFAGEESGYFYSRLSNPTVRAFEEKVASLEGAADAVAFGSGMGAASAIALTFLKSGDEVAFMGPLYGGTEWNEPLGQDHRPSHFALVSRYADHTAKEPRCQDATTPAISNLRWWARSMLACPPPLSSAENIHSPPA